MTTRHTPVSPIDVECFECSKKPSEWCVTPKGIRRSDGHHNARVYLARTGDVEGAKEMAANANALINSKRRPRVMS